jgi:tRNA G10  N-methylase Trm11
VRNGNKTIIAQSIAVQDIEKYAARDQNRPYRDAKVGMLPPKLAQIIINLAVGSPRSGLKVYDPFCGTGVILQEALLMGQEAIGSDINPRMMEYSKKNLEWLLAQGSKVCPGGVQTNRLYSLSVADATKIKFDKRVNSIASEIFLGQPLSIRPSPETLERITKECGEILEKFLENARQQIKPGFRMCLAIPAWKTKNGYSHLITLDKLPNLGYNRVKFVHVSNEELVYHRPGQIVARELVVLERK